MITSISPFWDVNEIWLMRGMTILSVGNSSTISKPDRPQAIPMPPPIQGLAYPSTARDGTLSPAPPEIRVQAGKGLSPTTARSEQSTPVGQSTCGLTKPRSQGSR